MGAKGTQTSTQNTTQTTAPPAFVYDAVRDLIARGQSAANTPFSTYGGQRLAGFTGDQNAAFDAIRANMGAYRPYLDSAASYAQQGAAPLSTTYQNYLNPYQKQVTDATMASINESNAAQRNALRGSQISRGAFGNDRGGVGQAELARQQGLVNNQTLAGLNANNYTAALSAAQQDALRAGQASYTMGNLGQLSQNLGLQGAGALLNSGGMQQQQNQAGLNIPYQDWMQQRAYPFQTTQWLSQILGASSPLAGGTTTGSGTSTTTPAQPSIWSQLGGLGLAGLGIWGKSGSTPGSARGGRIGYADGGALEDESIVPDAHLQPAQALNVPAFEMKAPAAAPKSGGGDASNALAGMAKMAMMMLADGGRVHRAGGGGLGGAIGGGDLFGGVPSWVPQGGGGMSPAHGLNIPAFQMKEPGIVKPAWDPVAMGKAAAPVLGKASGKLNSWMNEPTNITPERFSFSPGAIGSVGGIGEMNPSAGVGEAGSMGFYASGGEVDHRTGEHSVVRRYRDNHEDDWIEQADGTRQRYETPIETRMRGLMKRDALPESDPARFHMTPYYSDETDARARRGYADGGELDEGIDIPARIAGGHTVNSDYWIPADANAQRIVRASRGFDPLGDPSPTDVWPAKPAGGWEAGLGNAAPSKPRLLPSEMDGPVVSAPPPSGLGGASPSLAYLQSQQGEADDGEDGGEGPGLISSDELSAQRRGPNYLEGIEDPKSNKPGGPFGLSSDANVGLIAAGLGMMAGTSPWAGVNIGQGGLAGVKAYQAEREGRRKQELSRAQMRLRAQQLMDQMTRHKETLGSLDKDRQERSGETKRQHDLQDAQRREERARREQESTFRSQDRADALASKGMPGEGTDPDTGETVKGFYQFNPESREYEFRAGMQVTPKGAQGRSPMNDKIVEQWREEQKAATGEYPNAEKTAAFKQTLFKSATMTPERETFNALQKQFEDENGRKPNGDEIAGLRQKAAKQSDSGKQRTVAAHEVVNYIDEALAHVQAAKSGKSGPVSGVKGDVNRLFETGKGMVGMEHDTTPSDFQQRIDLITSAMPRLMQGTSRVNKGEIERAERIVGGLARLKTEDDVINNLKRVRESMINIAGSEPPPKAKSGAADAPKAATPKPLASPAPEPQQRPANLPEGARWSQFYGGWWVIENGKPRKVAE